MEKEKLTSDSVKNFDAEVDYTTVLDNFEGPLDLLLYFIRQARIEIKDVFVSHVTEQFLEYIKGLPTLDLEKASEYLNIAATIIDIKARSLLPPPEDEWGVDGDDGFFIVVGRGLSKAAFLEQLGLILIAQREFGIQRLTELFASFFAFFDQLTVEIFSL